MNEHEAMDRLIRLRHQVVTTNAFGATEAIELLDVILEGARADAGGDGGSGAPLLTSDEDVAVAVI